MESPSTDRPNGGAGELIEPPADNQDLDPRYRGFISASEAQKKYGVHQSTVHYWRNKGAIRSEGKLVAEEDVRARVNSPEFAKHHAGTIAGHKKSGKRIGRRPKPERGEAALLQPEARKPKAADLSHHVAYVAGYTDCSVEHYARSNGLDALALRAGLAEVLRAKQ